jgi:hypothetical protein
MIVLGQQEQFKLELNVREEYLSQQLLNNPLPLPETDSYQS